ncbi:MAG TPA: hypothetical protein VL978_18870 [Puia sp.]|nr:hypothetical protein [Puia sp.]
MTARTLPFILSVTFFLSACSHKLAPLGHYQTTPVVADGIADDWTLPLRFANATYTLQYNITNDNRNIYVCVLSRDEQTMLRMLRSGITVYFDPKGQNSRDISLHYPLRKQPDPNIRNRDGEPLTNRNDSSWEQELLAQSDSYGTTGFSGIENGQFAVKDSKSPIRVAIQFTHHDSLLVYEAIIPIVNVLGAALSSRNPKKPFSVGVVLNAPSGRSVARNQHHYGGRGMNVNGIHMGGSGGGGSRRNYNTDGDNPPIREDANWYQFRLANGQAKGQ